MGAECKPCSLEPEGEESGSEDSNEACPWATKCINSDNKCQKCNKSPWYDKDGQRCVCGSHKADWIHKAECKPCSLESEAEESGSEDSNEACPWATKCINSDNKGQKCNKSP